MNDAANLPVLQQQAAPPMLARAIAKPKELIDRHIELTSIINETFTKNVDFGVIPGTNKPTLLKPGAERMCIAFGASPQYQMVTAEVDHGYESTWTKVQTKWVNNRKERVSTSGTAIGLYRYIYKCKIVRFDGRVLGEGEGSCSTLESKYCDRPRDLENTVIKMAQKRALIAAVLNAFGLSDRFTQDVEDFHHEDEKTQPTNDKYDVEQDPTPPPKPKPTTFNARDKADIDWLKKEVAVELLDATTQKKIALELHGLEKSELNAAIKRVEAAFIQEIAEQENKGELTE